MSLTSSSTTANSATVAFFDLDRTLLDLNSAHLWIKREWKAGYLSTWSLLRAACLLLQYHWGRADLEDAFIQSGPGYFAVGSLHLEPGADILTSSKAN